MRPVSSAPIATAGLTLLPGNGPIRYPSASSVRPNAKAVTTTPAATLPPSNLKPNISVAAPTARNTKIAVPRNSAANFRIMRPPDTRTPTAAAPGDHINLQLYLDGRTSQIGGGPAPPAGGQRW